jgi:hippurate hydrolase
MPIRNAIAAMQDEFSRYRRELHQNPQTAYEETYASSFVQQKLDEWGIAYKSEYGTTGVVATIEGHSNDSGRAIGLRADMDALDIEEQTGLDYASQNPGKMHACGHDGHTAMLLGAAKYLNETRNFDGRVHLIFQPAEEGENGAKAMMDDGLFTDIACDQVYGVHNWPWLARGQIAMREGPIMAAVDEFEITLYGKGGHAAFPQGTADPIVAASHLVTALQTLISREVDPMDTAVLSITNLNAGTGAHNVIPETATLTGTVRSFQPETRDYIEKRMRDICEYLPRTLNMRTTSFNYWPILDSTINSKKGVEAASKAAKAVADHDNVDTEIPACMGGEDFGAFLKEKPGAYVFIGQGEPDNSNSPHNHGLHSPYFDFNDEIIPIGVEYFTQLVERALAKTG